MESHEFGKYMRDLRTRKGLTVRKLEELSGVSPSYITNIENGKRSTPSPDILKKLEAPLGVKYEELMIKAGYWSEKHSSEDRQLFEGIYQDRWTMNEKLFKILKTLADDDGIFPDHLHEELFAIFGGWLPRQEDDQRKFDEWYSDFLKKTKDEITDSDIKDSHEEFNKIYTYTTVKNGILEYKGHIKTSDDFLNELVELMDRHDMTISIDEQEKLSGYPLKLDLKDLLDPSSATSIYYNGRALTVDERLQLLGRLSVLFPDPK